MRDVNVSKRSMNVAELESRMLCFIREKELLKDTRHVCVATSGGADSMVLLVMLTKFSKMLNVGVSAVHVNHGIRGESADRDEQFVEDFCKRNGIMFNGYSAIRSGIKVPAHASEEWARDLRYKFIYDEIKALGWIGVKAATAHTKSDQAETLIGNLYHGSGLNGMSGISAERGKIIRPVLCFNRAEIEFLAEAYGLEYVTDETNNTDDYRRNKIRHHIIPAFKVLGDERPEEYLSEACDKIAEANDFITRCGEEIFREIYNEDYQFIKLHDLAQQHKVIRVYIFGRILGKNNSKKLLTKLETELCRAMQFASEEAETQISVVVISEDRRVCFTNKGVYVRRISEQGVQPVRLNLRKRPQVDKNITGHAGHTGHAEHKHNSYRDTCCNPRTPRAEHRLTDSVYVICDEVFPEEIGSIIKRHMVTTEAKLREANAILADRTYGNNEFKPMARKPKKIKHFVGESGICIVDRPNIPLIFDDEGNAIWMCGVGFTDDFVATDREIEDGEGLITVYVR